MWALLYTGIHPFILIVFRVLSHLCSTCNIVEIGQKKGMAQLPCPCKFSPFIGGLSAFFEEVFYAAN